MAAECPAALLAVLIVVPMAAVNLGTRGLSGFRQRWQTGQ
jgi:hypothetical protein